MCFSASASFGISAVLLVGGIATVKKVNTPTQLPFAVIPIIFSIQQFIEGILWLSLTNTNNTDWHQPATLIFLIFAQVVWPFWVPFSIYLMEPDPKRKKILAAILSIGTLISFYLAYCIMFYDVNSSISTFHIRYNVNNPTPKYLLNLSAVLYFIPTVFPTFISSVKKMNIIGITLVTSFAISKLFFAENVVSVWCFFAAAISVVVFYIIASVVQVQTKFQNL